MCVCVGGRIRTNISALGGPVKKTLKTRKPEGLKMLDLNVTIKITFELNQKILRQNPELLEAVASRLLLAW